MMLMLRLRYKISWVSVCVARWTVNIETNIVLLVEFLGDFLVTYLITHLKHSQTRTQIAFGPEGNILSWFQAFEATGSYIHLLTCV